MANEAALYKNKGITDIPPEQAQEIAPQMPSRGGWGGGGN